MRWRSSLGADDLAWGMKSTDEFKTFAHGFNERLMSARNPDFSDLIRPQPSGAAAAFVRNWRAMFMEVLWDLDKRARIGR